MNRTRRVRLVAAVIFSALFLLVVFLLWGKRETSGDSVSAGSPPSLLVVGRGTPQDSRLGEVEGAGKAGHPSGEVKGAEQGAKVAEGVGSGTTPGLPASVLAEKGKEREEKKEGKEKKEGVPAENFREEVVAYDASYPQGFRGEGVREILREDRKLEGGGLARVRVVELAGSKPQFFRIEESVVAGGNGGEVVSFQTAMVADQVLVELPDGLMEPAFLRVLSKEGLSVLRRNPFHPVFTVQIPEMEAGSVPAMIARLQAELGERAVVSENLVSFSQAVPNDTYYGSQWDKGVMECPAAWDYTTGSRSVILGVIDDPVDVDHPELLDNIFRNWAELPGNGIDDDGNGYIDDFNGWYPPTSSGIFPDLDLSKSHGTHVAGIMAAKANNSKGVAGVNWEASVLPFAGGDGGPLILSNLIEGVDYMATMRRLGHNVVAVNHSYGIYNYNRSQHLAFGRLRSAGVLSFVAAGNDAKDNDTNGQFPANYVLADFPKAGDWEGITTVGSTNNADGKSSFSNYGATTVHLAAPGGELVNNEIPTGGGIWNLLNSPDTRTFTGDKVGTSMASPQVTGLAGLIASAAPHLGGKEIRKVIFDSLDALPSWAGKSITGGRINARKAIELALSYPETTFLFPQDGQFALGGQPVKLSVLAAVDAPRSIADVKFYYSSPEGSVAPTLIGQATQAYGKYSLAWTPPANGRYTVTAVATNDRGDSHTATATLFVQEVIVDDDDLRQTQGTPVAQMSWYPVTDPEALQQGYYGKGFVATTNDLAGSRPGVFAVGASFAFKPKLPIAGDYKVYARWPTFKSPAPSGYPVIASAGNARVDVLHTGGTATTAVDQQVNGGQWNLLATAGYPAGVYSFAAGEGGEVQFVNEASGSWTSGDVVVADAARFVLDSAVSGPIVAILPLQASIAETQAGPAYFVVSRSNADDASQALTVSYSVSGNAVSGEDFVALGGSITIPAGESCVLLPVQAIDDALAEGPKGVEVTILPGAGYTVSNQADASMEILSDESPGVLSFARYDPTVDEDAATEVAFTVKRTGDTRGAVSVSYSTVAGTAGSGDFTAVAGGTISWADGDAADKTITISITNDAILEAAEFFEVALSSPTGGATLGVYPVARCTILPSDPPGTLAFGNAAMSVLEGDGAYLDIPVARVNGKNGSVSISWFMVAGTAAAGSDFVSASGSLSWADQDNAAKTIRVSIVNDALHEASKSFTVYLQNPQGGAALDSAMDECVVTILDDDPVPSTPTEWFKSGRPFDLAGTSLTLRPVGSSGYVARKTTGVSEYPVSPVGGTVLNMATDGIVDVPLQPGETIPFYGANVGTISIATNGFIAMQSGTNGADDDFVLTKHFGTGNTPYSAPRKRISLFLNEMNATATAVSWKRVENPVRYVVTYDGITETSSGNQLKGQAELFLDGTIKLTYLSVGTTVQNGIVGLSAGNAFTSTDIANFVSDDFSEVPVERGGVLLGQTGDDTRMIEGEAGDLYTLSLSGAPVGDVTVYAIPPAGIELNGSSAIQEFVFTAENWSEGREVLVTATDNGTVDTPQPRMPKISHTVSSGADSSYDGLPSPSLTVKVFDDEDVTPPANATALGATAGNGTLSLAWTNPVDADFDGVLVIRGTAPLTGSPVQGTDYEPGHSVGSGTVVYKGKAAAFSDPSIVNETTYYYRVIAFDGVRNYPASPPSVSATPSADTVVEFRHEGSAHIAGSVTQDTYLDSATPDNNCGKTTTLSFFGSSQYALVRWDVTGLPVDANVTRAELTFTVTTAKAGKTGSIYECKTGWIEGTLNNATPADGATFNKANGTSQTWAGGGAFTSADYGSSPLGSFSVNAAGEVTCQLNAAGLAYVKSWLVDSANNKGFVLASDATASARIGARNNTTVSSRPKLTIFYNQNPPEPENPFLAWKAAHGLDEITGAAGADPDGDGIKNLAEFALNLDPTLAVYGGLPLCEVEGANLKLTYRKNKAAAALTYTVQSSPDLAVWTDETAGSKIGNIDDDTESWQFTKAVSGQRLFLRLKIAYQ